MSGNTFPEIPGDGNTEPANPAPYLHSITETARLLGKITEREVYNRIAAGDLESVNIGRRRFVVHESLDRYVARLREVARRDRDSSAGAA